MTAASLTGFESLFMSPLLGRSWSIVQLKSMPNRPAAILGPRGVCTKCDTNCCVLLFLTLMVSYIWHTFTCASTGIAFLSLLAHAFVGRSSLMLSMISSVDKAILVMKPTPHHPHSIAHSRPDGFRMANDSAKDSQNSVQRRRRIINVGILQGMKGQMGGGPYTEPPPTLCGIL
ncbi:hypothetical protein HOY80DRAFT_764057 [Tuber brumale]|nr:hypothetical protein HOY80DRAFT_764057 [Tuber brumale]